MRRLALAAAAMLAAGPACAALKVERIMGVLSLGRPMEVVAEQALVLFSSQTSVAQRKAQVANLVGGSLGREVPGTGWTVVNLGPGVSVIAAVNLLKNAPGVANVQPNHLYRPTVVPNDPLVPQQYALQQINAFAGWEFETGSTNKVTIAMLDAGVDGTHPDLSSKLTNTVSQDCSSGACANENPPHPACNHGTRTAGIAGAAASNGAGIAGMSWGAQLVSLKVFADANCPTADCSDASCLTDDASMSAALNKAIALNNTPVVGRVVVNMSVGASGLACGGTCPGLNCLANTQTAIANAVAAGIPVVISAGNDSGPVNAPANCAGVAGGSGIIPVAATDSENNIAAFSSNGPELAANGVAAPGVNVETTDIGGAYTGSATGTSFSAPHVAGLAALILSSKPAFTPAQVQNSIRGGADGIGVSALAALSLGVDSGGRPLGNLSGAGRINLLRSMRLAVNGTLADYKGDQAAIAFPNPFRVAQAGMVSFSIPVSLQGTNPKIKIYAADGVLVRTLSGQTWDGKNEAGNPVASGTYLFLVTTGAGSTRGRVAVIR